MKCQPMSIEPPIILIPLLLMVIFQKYIRDYQCKGVFGNHQKSKSEDHAFQLTSKTNILYPKYSHSSLHGPSSMETNCQKDPYGLSHGGLIKFYKLNKKNIILFNKLE